MPQLHQLLWIEELLPSEILIINKRGGRGYYFDDRLILILIESGTSCEHQGITYPFQLWNGCFFPIENIKQNTVYAKFQFLENHPALKESLYLPLDSENFSEEVQLVLREIKKGNPLFGVPIKNRTRLSANSLGDDFDTSKPTTFGDAADLKRAVLVKPKGLSQRKAKVSKKNDNNFLLTVLKKKTR